MAKNTKPAEESSTITKQAVEQAHAAADSYFDLLKKIISSFPSGGTELGEKLKGYAEQNITALHEFVRKLSEAKDVQDAIRIQTEFMQTQVNAFGDQARDLGETSIKAAAGAMKVPST
jgi:phasin